MIEKQLNHAGLSHKSGGLLILLIFLAIFLFSSASVFAAATCEEMTNLNPFSQTGGTEAFNEDVYKDGGNTTVTGWGDGNIHDRCSGIECLLLPQTGIDFIGSDTNIQSTNWMKSAVGGDFNGDGVDDIVAGGNQAGGCAQNGSLAFLPNETFDGNFATETVFTCGDGDTVKGLSAEDYDGDGDFDVASYDLKGHVRIWLNDGLANFDNTDIAYSNSAMDGRPGAWETGIDSADINGDGDIDLLLATDAPNGNVKYLENQGDGTFVEPAGKGSIPVGFSRSNVVGLADFDQDGDMDFVVGSTFDASREIKLYLNDGNENFTFERVIDNTLNRPTFIVVADFDRDGKTDFVVGTDGNSPSSNDSEVYWFVNTYDGVTVSFAKNGPLKDAFGNPFSVDDFDNGGVGDFDDNGYMDIFVADGNDAQAAYLFELDFNDTFASDGVATSENVIDLDPDRYAVTSATLTSIVDNVPLNTSITYQLCNGGCGDKDSEENWHDVNAGNGWTVSFPTYGSELRWRAKLHSDDRFVTPTISLVDIDFAYVEKTEFFRAEIIVDPLDPEENNLAVLYQGSFVAPSQPSRGFLRKYRINDIIDNPSAPSPLWTADGTGNDRIYTLDGTGSRCILSSTCPGTLTAGQVSSLSSLPLGGIDHSAPSIVGEPVYPFWYFYYTSYTDNQLEREDFMAFKDTHSSRMRVVYVGATDGMLHAIKAEDGAELWRYLPQNNQSTIANNLDYPAFTDDAKVDASPAVADVRFRDGSWHTILVSPLGSERNAVFALDVTIVMDPQVLWEVTGGINLGNIRSHPAILRVKLDGSTRYVTLISSGRRNDNQDGFAVYALDIETGDKVWEFNNTDPSGGFLPASLSAIDSDYDGYVDRAYVGDSYGRLWEFRFDPDATTDVSDIVDAGWTGSILYTDSNGNPVYARPAVAFDSQGNLVVYFGTAGDTNNRFYAIYAEYKPDATQNGTAKYVIGDGDGRIGNDKIYASPILNRGRATFVTSTGAVDTWAFCSESAGDSVIYTVSPTGSDVRAKQTDKTTSTPQADDGKTITVDQTGDFGVEDPSSSEDGTPIPGDDPPDGSGDPVMRVKGWSQIY